jgi:hypothetical protein
MKREGNIIETRHLLSPQIKVTRHETDETDGFSSETPVLRPCKHCQIPFFARSANHRFCSSKCRLKHWRKDRSANRKTVGQGMAPEDDSGLLDQIPKPRRISILEALKDRDLFGALFPNLEKTWQSWLAFLGALYGLRLSKDAERRFCRHTGHSRYRPPPGGWLEAVCIVGRQAGKSIIAALVAAYEAISGQSAPDGTERFALLVAQDHRAALRTLLRYAISPFEKAPLLRRAVIGRTADTVTLDTGVILAAYPCRPAAVRGVRAAVAVCDELAFFRNSEGSPQDREMLTALRPTLATTGGRLIILSSPYAQSGALWDLYRQHYGQDNSPVLVWQATAPQMNPTLPKNYLERMRQDDPDAYRSEVLGEFRTGTAALFDSRSLEACVIIGRKELMPFSDVMYSAFVDPSGGRGDAFALSIGHREGERLVVDVVRAWKPPFNPSGIVEEAAGLLRRYDIVSVVGDRYAGEWPRESFRSHDVFYETATQPKSELYLSLLPAINAGIVELPDDPELLRQFRNLERRRGSSGKDRVDHRPGAHDDLANAVAGLVNLLAEDGADGEPRVWYV